MNGLGGIGSAGSVQQIMAMRQQILDRSNLLKEVHSAAQAQQPAEPNGAPAAGFTDALKNALDGVTATQRNAESLSAAYERGEFTDLSKVMLARQESGIAFEATLQVRNRLLSAYQDIMRMGV